MTPASWSCLLVVFSLGCSSGSPAVSACNDYADAVGKAAQRCGLDYKMKRDNFEKNLPTGSCANIERVRDEASLRGECFSFWMTTSCMDLVDPNLVFPPGCEKQLVF